MKNSKVEIRRSKQTVIKFEIRNSGLETNSKFEFVDLTFIPDSNIGNSRLFQEGRRATEITGKWLKQFILAVGRCHTLLKQGVNESAVTPLESAAIRISNFEFVSDFELRISSLVKPSIFHHP
jgi:hypothetical protein